MKTFINYNVHKALPYWFRRYVRMDKTAHLEPLLYEDDDLAVVHSRRNDIEKK